MGLFKITSAEAPPVQSNLIEERPNMNMDDKAGKNVDEKISQNFEQLEKENEKKLLNLIVEVMVKITLKEFYETGDQVPEI